MCPKSFHASNTMFLSNTIKKTYTLDLYLHLSFLHPKQTRDDWWALYYMLNCSYILSLIWYSLYFFEYTITFNFQAFNEKYNFLSISKISIQKQATYRHSIQRKDWNEYKQKNNSSLQSVLVICKKAKDTYSFLLLKSVISYNVSSFPYIKWSSEQEEIQGL